MQKISPGYKTQAFLCDRMKTLLPESPIYSNTTISPESLTITEEDRLRIFEFDVSFERTNRVAAVINDGGYRSTIEISSIIS
jgi:hypothetical protein